MPILPTCPECGRSLNFIRTMFLTSFPILPGINDRAPCPAPHCGQVARYDMGNRIVSALINIVLVTGITGGLLYATWPALFDKDMLETYLLVAFGELMAGTLVGFVAAYSYFIRHLRFEQDNA